MTTLRVATMNGIDRGFADGVIRLMQRELAELKEMMSLGAGIPGDEQRIEMIKGLLSRWPKIMPVIIYDAVESHFQTRH